MILPLSVAVNIAVNKPTKQSSTKSTHGVTYRSSKAVDGRTSSCRDCTCTLEEKDPWWRVDLLAVYSVSSVTVATDQCCGANLEGFIVKVTNISSPSAPCQQCNNHEGRVGAGSPVTINCSPHPVSGHYLYIQIPGDSRLLTLCEVQVDGVVITHVNIAVNKPTEQSSTLTGYVSSKAVDGDTSASSSDCTQTREEKDPWWRVDLLAVYSISSVTVVIGDRLHDFIVKVTNISSPSAPYQLCNIITESVSSGRTKTIRCSPPVFGRYLYIQIPGDSEILNLCEVHVEGVVISAGTTLPNKECKIDSLGKNYTGLVRTTGANLTCQRWNSQSLHTHKVTAASLPDDTLKSAANYCRNPDNELGPWCYTTKYKPRWSFCNVHNCPFLSANLALNKSTNQSSTRAEGGAASRAVDGNKDTAFSHGSCTHTAGGEQKPWWKVDLGIVYAVYKVMVTNRRGYHERLSNFDIRVSSNTHMTPSDPLCRHYPWTVGSNATVEITCDKAVYGRYLYIQLSGSEPLTLCEVEVYGLSVAGYVGGPTDVNEMKTPGSKLSIFTNLRVELDGFLIGWKFNAARTGTVWADIWRQKGITNEFMLVYKTEIIVTYSGEQEMRLTNGVQVKQGDVIGYHYASNIPSTQTVIRVKDSTDNCCSHVTPGAMYNKRLLDGSLTNGQTYNVPRIEVLRMPAMQALVDSRNHWWQSSTLAQSGNKMTITFLAWPSVNTHLPTATKFTVQYRRGTSTSWSQVGGDITPGSLLTGDVRREIDETAGGLHQFKGQVFNGDGTRVWTSVKSIMFCTAPTSVQNLNGTSKRQSSSTKATLTLTWDEPQSINCNSILHYLVIIQKKGESAWDQPKSIKSRYYTFRGLDAYTEYNFGVVAVNDRSLQSGRVVITERTVETVPSPVTSLGVTPSSTRSLVISWGVPTQPNGVITRFKIGCRLIKWMACSPTPQPTDYVYNTTTTTQYTLDGLEEYAQYDIKVEARTSVGYGQSSNKQSTTLEELPSVAPQLTPSVVTSRKLTLIFSMRCEDINGGNGIYRYQVTNRSHVETRRTQETVTGLTPYTSYSVKVAYCNYKGCGPERAVQIQTDQDVPSRPVAVGSVGVNDTSLLVTWSPPFNPNGIITGYRVNLWSEGETPTNQTQSDLSGKLNNIAFHGLEPSTVYSIQVFAKTIKGYGKGSTIITGVTSEGKPDKPVDVQNITRTDTSLGFKWKEPVNPRGKISGYEISCQLMRPHLVTERTSVSKQLDAALMGTIEGLLKASRYECTVTGKTSAGYGAPSDGVLVWTAPPTASDLRELVKLPPVKTLEREATDTTVTVKLLPAKAPSSLTPSHYIVIVETKAPRRKRSISQCRSDVNPVRVNYTDSRRQGLTCYVAALLKPNEVSSDGTNFVIGDGKTYNGYVNKPLEKGQSYDVYYGATVNVDGATSTAYQHVGGKSHQAKEFVDSVGIGLGVFFALAILVAAIGGIIFIRRRNQKSQQQKQTKKHGVNEVSELRNLRAANVDDDDGDDDVAPRVRIQRDMQDSDDSDDSRVNLFHNPGQSETYNAKDLYGNVGPVSGRWKTTEFLDYVVEMNKQGKDAYKEEYGKLPNNLVQPHKEGAKQENKKRNRYGNIIPYDKSRVVLETLPSDPNSHYINATYIVDFNNVKSYVASQGPNPNTVDDFMRMIWETGTNRIVMLTNLVESGKRKCEKYWPNLGTSKTHGNIDVTLVQEEAFPEYTVRTLSFTKFNELRNVKQFHFTVWPDHGVPKVATSLLNFRRKVHLQDGTIEGPVIVHCSAGVGRTGTYIAVDLLLAQHRADDMVDVFGCVEFLRNQRVNMVQTQSQYHFLHNAVAEAIRCGETAIECINALTAIPALMMKNRQSGKSTLELQFELLQKVRALEFTEDDDYDVDDPVIIAGLMESNVGKNRDKSIYPTNSNRPILMTPVKGRGDYINATFVKDNIIMTQMPYPDDIVDFWRMVYDHDIDVIVMLNELDRHDSTCVQYWPMKQEILGVFNVEVVSEVKHSCYMKREIKVKKRSGGDAKKVCHIQLTSWPKRDALPKNPYDLITVMEEVRQRLKATNSKRFAVHCLNGAERSGLYLALVTTCEKIQLEQEVDVFQAVKHIREFRPQCISSVLQYKMIYDTAVEFIESHQTYSNFH